RRCRRRRQDAVLRVGDENQRALTVAHLAEFRRQPIDQWFEIENGAQLNRQMVGSLKLRGYRFARRECHAVACAVYVLLFIPHYSPIVSRRSFWSELSFWLNPCMIAVGRRREVCSKKF